MINKTQIASHAQADDSQSHIQSASLQVSRSGRKINRPARLTAPSEEGEDVRTRERGGAKRRERLIP